MPDMSRLLDLLSLVGCEEPLGIAWSDSIPERSRTPRPGSRACIMRYLRMARRDRCCVHFTPEVVGCMGGWTYLGFLTTCNERISQFVTTGWEGMEGEHYLPRPESMLRFLQAAEIQHADKACCLVQPLSLFGSAGADLAVFFCRPEELTGLAMLASFALDSHDALAIPFGAGCTNIFTWPRTYRNRGLRKAVVGGQDPSCRPFVNVDEVSFTVTSEVLDAMLAAIPDSFLTGHTWAGVRKKVDRSRRVWERQED